MPPLPPGHGPGPSPRAVVAIRLLLPSSLLCAAFVFPSLPSAVYLVAFLLMHVTPPHGARPKFPYSTLLLLLVYSAILIAVHIALAVLIARGDLPPHTGHFDDTFDGLAVPRYDLSPWKGIRSILGPVIVFIACLVAALQPHFPSKTNYISRAFMLFRVNWIAAGRYRALRKRLRRYAAAIAADVDPQSSPGHLQPLVAPSHEQAPSTSSNPNNPQNDDGNGCDSITSNFRNSEHRNVFASSGTRIPTSGYSCDRPLTSSLPVPSPCASPRSGCSGRGSKISMVDRTFGTSRPSPGDGCHSRLMQSVARNLFKYDPVHLPEPVSNVRENTRSRELPNAPDPWPSGFMTLEAIEEVIGDSITSEEHIIESDIILEHLSALGERNLKERFTQLLSPYGEEAFQRGIEQLSHIPTRGGGFYRSEAHGRNGSFDSDENARALFLRICRGNVEGTRDYDFAAMDHRGSGTRQNDQTCSFDNRPNAVSRDHRRESAYVPSRLTFFLATHGGIYWSLISTGLAGSSYSSLLTFVFLLSVLTVAVAWAFHSLDLLAVVRRRAPLPLRLMSLFRVYVFLYIIALYAFQLPWLNDLRATEIAYFVGLVPLDTAVERGWAHIMAMGASVVAFVVSGMHAMAVRAVMHHESRSSDLEEQLAIDGNADLTGNICLALEDSRDGGFKLGPHDEISVELSSDVHSTVMQRSSGQEAESDISNLEAPTKTLQNGLREIASGGQALPTCTPQLVRTDDQSSQFPNGQTACDGKDPVESMLGDVHSEAATLSASGEQQKVGSDSSGGNAAISFPIWNEVLFCRGLTHVASLGLLAWGLVFPGIFTLPLLFAVFANLAPCKWRFAQSFDGIVCYAVVLELVFFLYAAATDAFGIEDSAVARLLSLRRFRPQFVMNMVQLLALVLFCISLRAKRYLDRTAQGQSRGISSVDELVYLSTYTAKWNDQLSTASPVKVFVDQIALASLYVTGCSNPSALNALFMVALTVICIFQAAGLAHRKFALPFVWTALLAYSAGFVLLNAGICRAGAELWTCDRKTLGVVTATTAHTVAYAVTVIFAAVQVHFTWPWGKDSRDSAHISEFESRFWRFLREYFILFSYSALLLYPLTFPANYVSYVYMVILLICILVEILAPDYGIWGSAPGSRAVVRVYWLIAVIFSSFAMLGRYFVRFAQFENVHFISLWVFGLNRGISGFVLTLGDAVILILLSLQGRLLIVDKLASNAENLVTQGVDLATQEHEAPTYESEGVILDSGGECDLSSNAQVVEPERCLQNRISAEDASAQPALRRTQATIVDGKLRVSPRVDSDNNPYHSQARLAQAVELVRNLRKSFPVKRTELFFGRAYDYVALVVRLMLLKYNYVFESLAILVAAVWLDGVSLFGAVYLFLGCILMVSIHASTDAEDSQFRSDAPVDCSDSDDIQDVQPSATSRCDRFLPPLLAVLSFSLMSVQYLYIILSSSGSRWGPMAEYIGLQSVSESEPSRGALIVPITQHAMIAHVLVFVMAFLQRAAIRWKVLDEERGRIEKMEQRRLERMTTPMQDSADALNRAISVSYAIPGVGGKEQGDDFTAHDRHCRNIQRAQVRFRDAEEAKLGIRLSHQLLSSHENDSLSDGSDHPSNANKLLRRASSFDVGKLSESSVQWIRSSRSFADIDDLRAGDRQNANDIDSESDLEDLLQNSHFPSRRASYRKEWEHISEILYRQNQGCKDGKIELSRRKAISTFSSEFGPTSDHEHVDGTEPVSMGEPNGKALCDDLEIAENSTDPVTGSSTKLRKIRASLYSVASNIWGKVVEIVQLLVPFWGKWGFDVTFIYLVVGAAVTKSIFSVIYVLLVFVVGRLPQMRAARFWQHFTVLLIVLVIAQYGLALGLPPSKSVDTDSLDFPGSLSQDWAEWLYLDSMTRRTTLSSGTTSRKAGITFGFLGVICAGITLNALSMVEARDNVNLDEHGAHSSRIAGDALHRPSPSSDHRCQDGTDGLSFDDHHDVAGCTARGLDISNSLELNNSFRRTESHQSADTDEARVLHSGASSTAPISVAEVGEPASTSCEVTECSNMQSTVSLGHCVRSNSRCQHDGNRSFTEVFPDDKSPRNFGVIEDSDFTRRPLSFKNWVKLTWMRFAGSAVQLVMFGIASFDTNVMSAVLLMMSLYFFLQFTNFKAKQSRFEIVRSYVLLVILLLVIYQAPFSQPNAKWSNIIGLYKTSSGNSLLYLMVVLWLFCQMQIRIYESPNFKFVVKCTEEEETVRWHRAVHEHNDRMYEKMLGRNKNYRAKAARQARVNALETLRHENKAPPTELFYRVCVVNWMALLRARADSTEQKELKASIKKEREEEERNVGRIGSRERFARFLIRGSGWRKHAQRPFSHEMRLFILRYSSWPVYFTMILAAVVSPSILTIVYPIILFLYLVLEQPRPPKQVWTGLILYVYAVIIVKYIGRKGEFIQCHPKVPFIFSGGLALSSDSQPSVTNIRMCGIAAGIFFDILVLLALLWHRALLYYRGLWDLPQSEEELRLRKDIKCDELGTPEDMSFRGFEESSLPLTSQHHLGPNRTRDLHPSEHSYLSAADQYRLAEDALLQAQCEIDNMVSDHSEGPETWDPAILAAARPRKMHDRTANSHEGKKISHSSALPSSPRMKQSSSDVLGNFRSTATSVDRERSLLSPNFAGSGVTLRRGLSFRNAFECSTISDSNSQISNGVTLDLNRHGMLRDFTLGGSENFLRRRRTMAPNMSSLETDTAGSQMQTQRGEFSAVSHNPTFVRSLSSRAMDGAGQKSSESVLNMLRRRSTTRRLTSGLLSESNNDLSVRALEPASMVEESLLASNVLQPRPDSSVKEADAGERVRSFSALRSENQVPTGPFACIGQHFRRLLKPNEHKTVGDYYILIFSLDFICFVYMIFGYSFMFGIRSDQVKTTTWWGNNFIETKHLLSLLAMFAGIVVDRVVYLRRSMLGKLILQYVSVIVYHYVLFISTNIGTRGAAKAFYALKCMYFLVSGLQIRMGFPLYTTGQFLLRNYSTLGIVMFEIYNYIPFLWLMRTLLDWAVVETSLEIFQYFRFIDIYMWLYRNRAVNVSRGLFRRKLGQKRRPLPRIYQGAGLFLLCVILLFFPFFLFSFLNPFFESRDLVETSLSVDFVVGEETFRAYKRSVTIIQSLSSSRADRKAKETFEKNYSVVAVLREKEHLFLAKFAAVSEQLWFPTAIDANVLAESLSQNLSSTNSNVPKLSFTLMSMTSTQVFRTTQSVALKESQRIQISKSLQTSTPTSFLIDSPLPRYLILPSGSSSFQAAENNDDNKVTCIRLIFQSGAASTKIPFWSVEDCLGNSCDCRAIDIEENVGRNVYRDLAFKEHAVQVFLQVADVSALHFGGGTILTVYAVILITVASIAKSFMSNKRLIIPYIDMPYTLHLYQLVMDVVYARQDKDLVMEEILYNGLVDIYRDTHELAKWSGQRALKVPREWWSDDQELIDGYAGWPSFRETETEPYIERSIDGESN